MIHWHILDLRRKNLLPKLSFTGKLNFYLAGGTALALQIGHRTSIDFDFYSGKKFKKGQFRNIFQEELKGFDVKFLRDDDDTFELKIDDINLSYFYYPYELIRKTVGLKGVEIASIEDIAAMKMIAIVQRGTFRDFVDIYYLIQKFGLLKIFELTSEKYKSFDIYSGLRGLIYFDDAEKSFEQEQKRVRLLDKNLTWKNVKNYIKKTVITYQRSFLKD